MLRHPPLCISGIGTLSAGSSASTHVSACNTSRVTSAVYIACRQHCDPERLLREHGLSAVQSQHSD
eukprot:3795976-Amphidinium_carterae.1